MLASSSASFKRGRKGMRKRWSARLESKKRRRRRRLRSRSLGFASRGGGRARTRRVKRWERVLADDRLARELLAEPALPYVDGVGPARPCPSPRSRGAVGARRFWRGSPIFRLGF